MRYIFNFHMSATTIVGTYIDSEYNLRFLEILSMVIQRRAGWYLIPSGPANLSITSTAREKKITEAVQNPKFSIVDCP